MMFDSCLNYPLMLTFEHQGRALYGLGSYSNPPLPVLALPDLVIYVLESKLKRVDLFYISKPSRVEFRNLSPERISVAPGREKIAIFEH